MAKGNMLLGYSRGSVGDVVFYRDGGLQRTRARNRNPRNPKSSRQMLQRSLMANCVKFYKTATAGLFRFGFETKKYNESDYNAFVRVNIKRGVNISKTAFDTQWYGAIGNWRMTEGSLQSITTTESSSKPYFDFGVTPTESVPSNTTVGWLSSQLINGNPNRYMAGDIITLCAVLYNTPGNGMPAVSPTPSQDGFEGRFATLQFRLNTSDTREVADVTGAGFHVATVDGHVALGLSASESAAALEWSTGILGICCIQSRNTAEGTKVSTQDLFTNAAWNTAVEACKDTDYISAVLADWQAGGEAILQGGASTDFENPFDYATVVLKKITVDATQTAGDGDQISEVNGTYIIPISKTYVNELKINYQFPSAEKAAIAYAALKGTDNGGMKNLTSYVLKIGSTSLTWDNIMAVLDNNLVKFQLNATQNNQVTRVTEDTTITFATQGVDYSAAITNGVTILGVSESDSDFSPAPLAYNLSHYDASGTIEFYIRISGITSVPTAQDISYNPQTLTGINSGDTSYSNGLLVLSLNTAASIPTGVEFFVKLYGKQIAVGVTT